jgi:hypothetical protein
MEMIHTLVLIGSCVETISISLEKKSRLYLNLNLNLKWIEQSLNYKIGGVRRTLALIPYLANMDPEYQFVCLRVDLQRNFTQDSQVRVDYDNDDELPAWNATTTARHAYDATWDAIAPSRDATSGTRTSFELSNATRGAGTKVPEMGTNAKEALWRKAQGRICGHGKAGMLMTPPLVLLVELTLG